MLLLYLFPEINLDWKMLSKRSHLHADHEGKHLNILDAPGYPDFIGAAIEACLAGDAAVACATGPDSLTLTGLAQGVEPVAIEYGTAPDGTHLLEVRGTLVPHMPMVVFRASGVPADVTFDEALLAFFSPRGMPSFPCTYD